MIATDIQSGEASQRTTSWSRTTLRTGLRWLLMLAGLFAILFAAYGSLSHRRIEAANATTGILLNGHSVGQTFLAQYDDLSAIEVRAGTIRTETGETRASLVLHVRSSPTSTVDLATAEVLASSIVPGNAWYRFSFPPLAHTAGSKLYLSVESPDGVPGNALTLFWYQAQGQGDPYGGGTAFRDGVSEDGDLSFGLVYAPSPVSLFAGLVGSVIQSHGGVVAIVLGALALALILAYAAFKFGRGKSGRPEMGLLIVLCLALAAGVTYMFVTPPWQGPDEHSHMGFVALLDRYGLDNARLQALNLESNNQDRALASAINSSMDTHNFTRWAPNPTPGATANAGGTLWGELHQPAPYYWLAAAMLSAGRSLNLAPDPYIDPAGALMWVRGTSVALSLVCVALAWVAGRLLGGQRHRWMSLALPVTVALLPMHSYIAGLANNDIAAEVVGSALFVCLVALFRNPTGWSSALFAGLTVLIALAAPFAKDSAYSILPFVGLALAVWLLRYQIWPHIQMRVMQLFRFRRSLLAVSIMGLGLVLAVVLLFAVLGPRTVPVAWKTEGNGAGVSMVETNSAHSGRRVLQLTPSSETVGVEVEQMLTPRLYHPGMQFTINGWARLAPGAGGDHAQAALVLALPQGRIGVGGVELPVAGLWVPITATAQIPTGDQPVTLSLAAYGPGSPVQFDDVSLEVEGNVVPLDTRITRYEIVNPSFEQTGFELRPYLATRLPDTVARAVDVMLNPQPFQKKNLWTGFATATFVSFWGQFGWDAITLPQPGYWVIGALCLIALIALVVRGVLTIGSWGWRSWLALCAIVGLSMGYVGVLTQQTITLAGTGSYGVPHGRYFLVAVVPFVWLILAGLGITWDALLSIARRISPGRATSQSDLRPVGRGASLSWGEWLLYATVALFAVACLVDLVIPYYYP